MTKIVSYNINGIRAGVKKGLLDWMKAEDFEIICFQETKAQKEQAPLLLIENMGYHHYWHSAEKKGYSGVATLSKKKADLVVEGCGIKKYDAEGRILRTDYGDWTLLNCYFPSGTSGADRQAIKMGFLDDFFKWIKKLKKTRPNLIIVGDYNIAHTESDIHNPKRKDQISGYKDEEREWMTKWFDSGFVDAYRINNPDEIAFSYWSTRTRARERNKGWRIDYQSVSKSLAGKIKSAALLTDVVHSDHCPLLVEYKL